MLPLAPTNENAIKRFENCNFSLLLRANPPVNPRSLRDSQVQRWIDAALIDRQTAARILAFEAGQERQSSLRWPVLLAMAFGGMLFAAGITLFVAAHWNELSPAARYSLVLFMVCILHLGGAVLTTRFPALATTFHAVGTAALGAAIFLAAQIFNLNENWATGILLWAVGAAAGYYLLRDWVHAGFLALLVPAWLIGQWSITTENYGSFNRPVAFGLVLTAICYLSARIGIQASAARRTLVVIGSIALLPCAGAAIVMALEDRAPWRRYDNAASLPFLTLFLGWAVAVAAPLILAWFLRGRAVWLNLIWALWTYALIVSAVYSSFFQSRGIRRHLGATLLLYGLCALGSVGLVAWGLYEKRKERVNLGVAAFALSILFFYFDSFMGKLGRSASLLILGFLCIAGGYGLEITRRRLMARMEHRQ
jgi:uncharacterized membrane protein